MTDKKKTGFALNKDGINRTGRPKGSRNKSSMMRAQYELDNAAEIAVQTLLALATNDKESLGVTDNVPPTTRLAAAKEILNKVIANEKDKIDEPSSGKKEEDVEEDSTPLVLLHAPAKSA